MVTAGQRILASDFTSSQFDSDATIQSNISTTKSNGSPEVSVTFTAPTSGKVLFMLGMEARDDGGFRGALLDWQLYETDATGTNLYNGGNSIYGLQTKGQQSTVSLNVGKTFIYTGLTPGQVYFARTTHQDIGNSGTVDVLSRSIGVVPLPS